MPERPESGDEAPFAFPLMTNRAPLLTGCAVVAIAALVVLGWWLQIPALKSFAPGWISMKPNTAVGLLLVGAALCAGASDRRRSGLAVAAATAALALAVTTLAQDVVASDFGIDQWFFAEDDQPVKTGTPGRMAPLTAFALMLVAGALLASRHSPYLAQGQAVVAAGIASLALLGYLFNVQNLYRVSRYTGMALPTAVSFLALAWGILWLRPEIGFVARLSDRSLAGDQFRQLLFAAIAIPIAIGAFVLIGDAFDFYNANLEVSVFTAMSVVALAGFAWLSSDQLRNSDRARADAATALRHSEERYRRAFHHVAVGMAQVAHDGRWLRVNARLCEILGYSESELLAKTYGEVSHLEDLPLEAQQMELLRRGEIEQYGLERRFINKAGETVYADVRWVRDGGRSANEYLTLTLQDITGRKLTEATLRVYERALASTQNGIVITDATLEDNPISYVNPAFVAMTGYEESEVLGLNCRLLNAGAREQEALSEMRSAIAEQRSCSVLLRNHRKNGEPFWNQVSIAPVENEAGVVTHFVGIQQDVSENMRAMNEREELLQRAETARSEAERANDSKNRFLSVVSHELRSPLHAVLVWVSVLRDAEDEAFVARGLDSIERSVNTQTRLLNELMDASRLRAGTLEVHPSAIDLSRCVRNTLDELGLLANERDIALHAEVIPKIAPAVADPERIEQIVRNLVENSLKFTPAGGRIDVELRATATGYLLDVRDNGSGISEAGLAHLFEEFWQEQRPTSGSRGLGLGLAIVKYLVEQHGGSIDASSDGPGKGARFRVHLPASARQADLPALTAPRSRDLRGMEMVVVDDDAPLLDAIAAAVEKMGAVAHRAKSYAEAARVFEEHEPEVLLSDIGLPDRSGLDLIQHLRAGGPRPRLVTIAITGLASAEDRRRIRRAGFDDFLGKPVSPAVVADRIRKLLTLRDADAPPARRILLVGDGRAAEVEARLSEAGHRVECVRDAATALARTSDFSPQVVILDLADARLNAAGLAGSLSKARSAALVVAWLATHPTEEAQLMPFDACVHDTSDIERLLRFESLDG